ncbi:MAG: TIGR04283 family arsenosugar biosynthesis glycosyltransferase [Bacteroidota bacterium]
MNNITGISIIIPAYNEAEGLGNLLSYLDDIVDKNLVREIIVVDGHSTDATKKIAQLHRAIVLESPKGRAKQMNFGAHLAKEEILYFLHADTFPPKGFEKLIAKAVDNGYEAGCFRMKFDTQNPVLRFFAYLSRINHLLCRGGDQSLFITRKGFLRNDGFNESYFIYEDSEFIKRLYKNLKFKVLPENVITSARKYREKGWLKVQFHFGMIHLKDYLGAKPDALYKYYERNLLR